MDGRRRSILKTGMIAAGGVIGSSMVGTLPAHAVVPDEETLRITRLSWAGIKLAYRKTTIFIDPWISTDIWDGAWKDPVVPLTVATERRHVLLTHLHNDHFDPAAIKQLATEGAFSVVVNDKKATNVASRGIRVLALPMYEPQVLGDFSVLAVPAVDGFGESQVHWIVSAGPRRLIHCGDSLWHGGFWKIDRQYGPFDVAFLPINGARLIGYQPFSDVEASMTPRHAVAAAVVMKAKLAVPIHYGISDPAAYLEHPNAVSEFRSIAEQRGQAIRVMQPGEHLQLLGGTNVSNMENDRNGLGITDRFRGTSWTDARANDR